MRTKLLAALGVTVFFSGAAMAQQTPAPIWSGFYSGLYGGSITAKSSGTLFHNDPMMPGVTASDLFGAGASQTFSPTGSTGALALGYNWQPGDGLLVLGVEADMAWVGVAASNTVTSTDMQTTWHLGTKLYSLGTLRGRAGIATGPVLWYGTAGLAWGLIETDNLVSCVGCAQDPWSQGTSRNVSHLGLIGGGGVEWLIGQYVVLRGEYLFASLDSAKHTFTGTSYSGTVVAPSNPALFVYDWDGIHQDLNFQMWRAGVSIKFN
jgi:outer membrane immunogenic protein